METNNENEMGTMKVSRLALKMSIPMVISMISIALYGIVDTMFISKISDSALTTISLSIPIVSIITGIGLGTGIGLNTLLAKTLGEKNIEKVNQIIKHGFFLTFISWICIALINMGFCKYFFGIFTKSEITKELGYNYLFIIGTFCIGTLFQILFEKILEAYGKTKLSMIVQFSGAIINLILDPIFIFGYFGLTPLGIKGAAIATVLGQIFGMLIGIIILLKEKIINFKTFTKFKFEKEIIKDIYKVGIPTIILECVTAFITLILNKILSEFSEDAISVWGIYSQLQKFVIIIIYGFNYAMIPLIAYNWGAKSKERIKEIIQVFFKMSIIITIIGTVLFLVIPKQLVMIFDVSDSVLKLAIPAFRILAISFIFIAIGLVFGAVGQAFGNGTYSLIINLGRQILIPLPLMFILKIKLGINGIWIATTIGAIVTAYIAFVLYKKIKKEIMDEIK